MYTVYVCTQANVNSYTYSTLFGFRLTTFEMLVAAAVVLWCLLITHTELTTVLLLCVEDNAVYYLPGSTRKSSLVYCVLHLTVVHHLCYDDGYA